MTPERIARLEQMLERGTIRKGHIWEMLDVIKQRKPKQKPVQYKCTVIDDHNLSGVPLEQWVKPTKREAWRWHDLSLHDIIRMAREAGGGTTWWPLHTDTLERFAELVRADERQKSLRLWMLLDDIDTADDIAKSDDRLYRSICQRHQKKRWEILSGEEIDAAIRARGNT